MYGSNVFRLAKRSSVRYYKNGSTKKLLEFLADMPKVNSARIAEAQHQRQNISKKGEKYGPSTVYLQVLGSGARGVPNTLYLFTDQKRYLFNCGECTQRLAHEHKVKLSRLEHVFITSKTWKNIGGLPGLSLTLQDVGLPKITLHGPEGLDELYNATKRFIIMKDMQVTMAPSSPAVDFEDSVMTIKYVHLSSQPTLGTLLEEIPNPCKRPRLDVDSPELNQFSHDKTDYYQRDTSRDSATDTEDKKSLKPRSPRSPERKDKKKSLQADLNGNYSVAYICTLKKRLGTLDLAKCVEKGVPPGPLLGQLKAGHDVVLPDGTLVLSKTVKTPDDPGPVFIVLELPDISYLCESEFAAQFDDGTNPPESIPTLIVHLSPPEVFNNDKYKAFIAKFGQKTQHLIVNADNRCLGSEAVHRTQHKLHLLDPEVFPLLKDPSIPAEWSVHKPMPKTNCLAKMKGFEDLKNRIALAQFQNILNSEKPQPPEAGGAQPETHSSRTLTMFHLRPKRQIDRSAEPKLQIQEYYQETMDMDGFVHSLEKFRGVVQDVRYAKNASNKDYPKLIFLGTGSCIPSKTRNTSAILVQVDPQNTILLDCGEGTFGQLVRFCGPRKVDDLLRTLKAIYISHLHADHHIGLIGVLQARAAAFAETPEKNTPLLLLAPGQIATWLSMYDTRFENIADEFTLVPNQNLMEESKEPGLTPALLAAMGLVEVQTCLVPHCPNAFGVALTAGGHKITYSGDTLPTEKLVELGKNSTILIHEATMEDELAEEARIKMHSTTSQAIEIGRKMNAKHTILTHFSQRYARLPRLNAHILNDNNTVGIAFDNMQVTLGDLPLLPHMYAPLQLMFAEHCVDMELKAASRERRKANSAGKDMETSPRSPRDSSRTDFSGKGSADTVRVKQSKSKKSDSVKPKIPLPRGRGDLVKNHPMSNMKIVQKPVVQRLCLKDRQIQQPSKGGTAMRPRATSVLLATSNELRYKENVTSKLRRKQSSSLNTSTTTILSDHKINIETLVAARTPPHTTPSSKSMTPQSIRSPRTTTPSPTPPPYRTSDDNKRMAKRQAYPKPNPYRPSDCKTYVMMKSNNEGYGQPLLKSSMKKLIIRPYPSPGIPRKPQSCESGSKNVGIPRASSVKGSVTKSYAPVLSDIESSFYILTKRHDEENIQSDDSSLWEQNPKASERKDEIRPVLLEPRVSFLRLPRDSTVTKPIKKFVIRKPDPVNEDLRQALLREAKAKFMSKEYLFESKYEKIEGLNWITWKS